MDIALSFSSIKHQSSAIPFIWEISDLANPWIKANWK